MKKGSSEIELAMKEAIKLEIEGHKFFTKAAEITTHPKGKRMFQHLAQEEVKHLETFKGIFKKALKGEEGKDYLKEEIRGEAPLVEKLKERIKGQEGKGEIEALSIGMELEKRAIELFRDSASKAEDPVAREIFLKILDEEKFHYDLLQAQYDSLTHSGFWLDSAEFRMDGKW